MIHIFTKQHDTLFTTDKLSVSYKTSEKLLNYPIFKKIFNRDRTFITEKLKEEIEKLQPSEPECLVVANWLKLNIVGKDCIEIT